MFSNFYLFRTTYSKRHIENRALILSSFSFVFFSYKCFARPRASLANNCMKSTSQQKTPQLRDTCVRHRGTRTTLTFMSDTKGISIGQ